MSVTNAKILKRNILLLKVSGYMVYIIEIFWKILKKKFWKKKSQIFSFGTPLPEKTYLGGPKEKIWKKNFEKKIFLLKVSGYMVYIIDFFLENFEKKNLK